MPELQSKSHLARFAEAAIERLQREDPELYAILDNEYRRQEENSLRSSGDNAYITSLSLSWLVLPDPGIRVNVVADNLTDSDFQEFPGTPPMGRQISMGIGIDW